MKFRKFLCFVLILAMMMSLGVTAFADEDSSENNTCVTIYASELDSIDTISELLNDPDVECVNVIFDSFDNSDYCFISEDSQNESGISPNSFGGPIHTIYVKDVRAGADHYGTTVLAKAEGQPGITVSISQTKTVSTTLSATFGASKSDISAKVGWSVTGSESLTIGGSYTVPYTYNGKNVKTATLCARAIYKVKYFDVYKGIPGTATESFLGTGNTKHPFGISFYKTYVYK